ncbi:hypothetical protein [Pseudoduganella violaceinigra]|uniref:hypothetical protein n=1 Tax=Pseudoduganella violaceinigra TaxID=246602 RepID=UPI00041F3FD4|nr:hypothetical protein [Pseudoduganella violaceinigra]
MGQDPSLCLTVAGAFIAASAWWHSMRGHEAAIIIVGTAFATGLPILRSYHLWREQCTCKKD